MWFSYRQSNGKSRALLTGGLDVRTLYGGLTVFGNVRSRKSDSSALNTEREIPQSVAFSLASETARGDMSIPVATTLPLGQRWHSRRGIQPVPVPRSSKERGRLGVGRMYSLSRITQFSVSGRGIKTGCWQRIFRGPKGWFPPKE